MAPVLVAILVSVAAGILAGCCISLWPDADPALRVTEAIEVGLSRRSRLRRFLRSRLQPGTATGLALTVALVGVVVVGAVVGMVWYMIRAGEGVVTIDEGIARWAREHATAASDAVLDAWTELGSTPGIVLVALAVGGVVWYRRRSSAIPLFIAIVIAGQFLISNLIKVAVDRVRPEVNPSRILETPSFPSGHSMAAAASFAALALLVGRTWSPTRRATLVGAAVALAVSVACTRVFLGVHWFSDAAVGLALGWTWFAVCAVAFGGRLLWWGAPAEVPASPEETPPTAVAGREIRSHARTDG